MNNMITKDKFVEKLTRMSKTFGAKSKSQNNSKLIIKSQRNSLLFKFLFWEDINKEKLKNSLRM